MPSFYSQGTTGAERPPRTPSPTLQGRPSLPPAGPAQQQEQEWVRDQRVYHLNLRNTIRRLETTLTTVKDARQICQQNIQQMRSCSEFYISIKEIMTTMREAGTKLDANEAQAARTQIIQHHDIAREITQYIRAAHKWLPVFKQREQELHEEYEKLCLHHSRVLALRREAMLSTPPVRYGDPFDKLVGAAFAFTPTCPLDDALYPAPPAPGSRCQFLTTGDRGLVQLRQARALAGLDVGLMDEEIAYRVSQAPVEWGTVGSMLGIDWSFVMGQDVLSTMDSLGVDESPPIWNFTDNARDS